MARPRFSAPSRSRHRHRSAAYPGRRRVAGGERAGALGSGARACCSPPARSFRNGRRGRRAQGVAVAVATFGGAASRCWAAHGPPRAPRPSRVPRWRSLRVPLGGMCFNPAIDQDLAEVPERAPSSSSKQDGPDGRHRRRPPNSGLRAPHEARGSTSDPRALRPLAPRGRAAAAQLADVAHQRLGSFGENPAFLRTLRFSASPTCSSHARGPRARRCSA